MWFILAIGADLHAHTWHRLHPRDAVTTSYLRGAYNQHDQNYHPRYVLDDDPATAWTEGADGLGEGESLTLSLTPTSGVTAIQLQLRSGYQKSEMLLEANGAPATLRVVPVDDAGRASTTLLAELPRTAGWQTIELTLPQPITLAEVQLEVVTVHPGTTYPDTCISDVQIQVDVPVDPMVEAANRAAILEWIAARQEVAALASKQPGPFASSSFIMTDGGELASGRTPKGLNALLLQMERARTQGTLTRGEPVRSLVPIRTGQTNEDLSEETFRDLLWLMDPAGIHFSATDQGWRPVETSNRGSDIIELTRSNLRVLHDKSGRLDAIYGQIQRDETYPTANIMRMSYREAFQFLARYADERLTELVIDITDADTTGVLLYVMEYSDAGQIRAFTEYRRLGYSDNPWQFSRYRGL